VSGTITFATGGVSFQGTFKASIMASATPAASGRGNSTYAPRERSFESFGIMLSG